MKNSRAANRLDKFALSAGIYFAVNTPDMRQQRKTILKTKGGLERPNIPNLLPHINSGGCWCDPIIKFNEDGELVMIHKEVTWN